MTNLVDTLGKGRIRQNHRPWPRHMVDNAAWRAAIDRLVSGDLILLGLWAEVDTVHMALLEEAPGSITVLSLDVLDGSFPSVGGYHAPAIRLERAIRDLHGHDPHGLPDGRPWLDHGRWGLRHPLGTREAPADAGPYPFLLTEGEGLHQIPVGPVHAGIIEPGHFRFTANGETVVRLEERFGYVHKGIEGLMAGADPGRAAQLAGRVSGDSTVAYALAFARALEAALDLEVPRRAQWLRGLVAELERVANHLGDVGAICNDAAFALMHAQCGILRELALRAADGCFGHRLMRDYVVPGGVAADLRPEAATRLQALIDDLKRRFSPLVELYDNTASLQDRTVRSGRLQANLARQYGAGGYVGRASGRAFDARRTPGYPPYDQLRFSVPVLEEGDVNARVWVRIREIEQSLSLIEQLLARLPEGPSRTVLQQGGAGTACEGLALVEGFRGDILVWLRINGEGRIDRCHLRDPSWFQWPLLEAVIEGNIVADFPLCNKSFNCSYSGHDL